MSNNIINLKAIEESVIQDHPFPFVMIPNFIQQEKLKSLIDTFPTIENRGSIPASSVKCENNFQHFLDELQGPILRDTIADKFAMKLKNKPTLLTLRGYTNERDGYIHRDSKDKLLTVLIYMNPTWDSPEGRLRLLNSKHSLDDFFLEVPPLAGTCLIFKVTRNCWHGHTTFIGKRHSLQLNYLTGKSVFAKHFIHHRLTAMIKNRFPNLFPRKMNY